MDSITGPVIADTVLLRARHPCDIFSKLSCTGAKVRRWFTALVKVVMHFRERITRDTANIEKI